jgi:hypothetical protein
MGLEGCLNLVGVVLFGQLDPRRRGPDSVLRLRRGKLPGLQRLR